VIVLGEPAVGLHRAGQAALVERHAGDHADVVLPAGVEELVPGRLVEHVVDHLHRVSCARLDQAQ
jgi:hypothetical protein